MTTHENVHNENPTFNQTKDLIVALTRQLPRGLTASEAKYWIENQKELANILSGLRRNSEKITEKLIVEWQVFFAKYFGKGINLEKVVIPNHQHGFDRILVVPQGTTLNQVIKVCKKHFSVYCYYDDLDAEVTHSDRDAKDRHYAIRIRDRVEADEEFQSRSANQLKDEGVVTMTLMERLILELKYYDETGKHLDVKNVTLCAGSRNSDGDVPYVYWHDGKLYVYWYYPRSASSRLRARAVVP